MTVITKPVVTNLNFIVWNGMQAVTIAGLFDESLDVCGSFTNSLTLDPSGAYPSPLFTFVGTTDPMTLTVNTDLITSTISYNFILSGALIAPGPTATVLFTVSLKHCDTTTITAPVISN